MIHSSLCFLLLLFHFRASLAASPQGRDQQQGERNADRPQLLRQLSTEVDMSKIQEVVPLEASNFYERLTRTDKQVLQNVLAKADSYSSTAEVLQDLRNGSSTLYDKAVQVVTSIRAAIAKLSPPARSFIDETVDQLRGALGDFSLTNIKSQAQQVVDRYRRLSSDGKKELREIFPMVATVVDNPIFQTMASGLFGIEEETNGNGGGGRDEVGGGREGGGGEAEDNGVEEKAEKKLIKH